MWIYIFPVFPTFPQFFDIQLDPISNDDITNNHSEHLRSFYRLHQLGEPRACAWEARKLGEKHPILETKLPLCHRLKYVEIY